MKRLWVDANVVLRHLTADPPELAERASRLMADAEAGRVVLLLTPLSLAEVFWVLKSFYGHPIDATAGVLLALTSAHGIEMQDRDGVVEALELVRDRRVDLADAYLSVCAARAGESVSTIDGADFKKLPATWEAPG